MRFFERCIILSILLGITPAAAQEAATEGMSIVETQSVQGTGVDVQTSLNPQPPTETVTQAVKRTDDQEITLDPYQPKGIQMGPFIILPQITVATYFDDNVFALPVNTLGDWAFVVRPQITIKSNGWKDTDVVFNGFVEDRTYSKYASENQVNGGASVAGQTLLDPSTQIVGRAQYFHGHEDRGVSETITTLFEDPIAYDQGEAALALNKRWGRYWGSLGGTAMVIQYDDAELAGIAISQDYRSGNVERLPVRVGYVVAPLTSIFVEGNYNWRNFEVDSFSSEGYRVVGGILLEPGQGARVTGEAYFGYMQQDYNGATLVPVSTFTAGGSLAWMATDKLTFTIEGRRDAVEASLSGGVVPDDGVSVVESVAAVRGDYRIFRNVVVGGGISYIRDEYNTASRTDDAWSPLASIKYFVDPTFTIGFDYRKVDFDSSGAGIESYQRNVYLLSANARF
jgi:hypothetical protein